MVIIKDVMITPNGVVSVFNEENEQVPHLQGCMFEVMHKIGVRANKDTRFYFKGQPLDLTWWFIDDIDGLTPRQIMLLKEKIERRKNDPNR